MSDPTLDSLLETTLDDLADLPTFEPYPAGAHRVTISFEEKVINKKPAVELKLVGISTEELSDTTDTPIVQGQETQVLYILTKDDGSKNEVSQGKLKEVLKPLAEATGESNMRAIMSAAKGMEVLVVTKKRHNKQNDTYNTDVVKLAVV
jgi:hypothetical protein